MMQHPCLPVGVRSREMRSQHSAGAATVPHMWFRRAVYLALAPAIIVLPVWLLLTAGIVTADSGWDLLLYLVLAPIVAVALAIVALLTWMRATVRRDRAVSPLDAGVFTAWWLSILIHGVAWTGDLRGITAALSVVLALVAFWSAIAQLVTFGRRSIEQLRVRIERTELSGAPAPGRGYDPRADDGPIIHVS